MSGLVVIGASYAGVQAALTARESGYAERITVIADERSLPYQRPPLSKDFLLDKVTQNGLVLRDEAFFKLKQIDLMLDTRVHGIDRHAWRLSINGNNTTFGFDKLFIKAHGRSKAPALKNAIKVAAKGTATDLFRPIAWRCHF